MLCASSHKPSVAKSKAARYSSALAREAALRGGVCDNTESSHNVQQEVFMQHGLDDVDDVVHIHARGSAPIQPLGNDGMVLLMSRPRTPMQTQ